MVRCGLNGPDAQHCEDRSGVHPVKRCAAFFFSPVSSERRNEIGAAVCAPGVDVPLSPARIMLTPLKSARSCRQLQNIRLSADAANGGLGHVGAGVARPSAAWSAREIESQVLATLATLAPHHLPLVS